MIKQPLQFANVDFFFKKLCREWCTTQPRVYLGTIYA